MYYIYICIIYIYIYIYMYYIFIYYIKRKDIHKILIIFRFFTNLLRTKGKKMGERKM